jgi:hypothetical protein
MNRNPAIDLFDHEDRRSPGESLHNGALIQSADKRRCAGLDEKLPSSESVRRLSPGGIASVECKVFYGIRPSAFRIPRVGGTIVPDKDS